MTEMHTMTPDRWEPPLVVLVGMGMGPDHVGRPAMDWVRRAQALAGGQRHLDGFPDLPVERVVFKGPLRESLERVAEVSRRKRTAVLASGDPFFFGIGRRLTELLGQERVFALPNVTSLQVYFARLREPWEDVKVISLHGRAAAADPEMWTGELKTGGKAAFFTDPQCTPDWIAREMLAQGFLDWEMAVGEDLGSASEKVRRFSLPDAAGMRFSPLNMTAVFRTGGEPNRANGMAEADGKKGKDRMDDGPAFGLPEDVFRHQAGLITKMEVRAVALAHLQLRPGTVLWDVGAGSGSVSIEAARLVPSLRVFAVERESRRHEDLVENLRRFGCSQVTAICGGAPEALQDMPDPDRVFIGGSGGNLHDILELIVRRLRPGGRIVQTVVDLDNLEAARSFWKDKPYRVELGQIQVSRGTGIGRGLRLEALNPVFIITATGI